MGSQVADPERNSTPSVRRRRDWPWTVLGVGLVLLKTEALPGLLHHRNWVIVILTLGLVSSVLRTRLIAVALTAGPLIAFALDPSSTVHGIAISVGAFALLLALFFATGTILMACQDHGRPTS